MKARILPLAILALLLAVAAPVRAALIFTLQRVSDTEAIMTATGSATDPGFDPDIDQFTALWLQGTLSFTTVDGLPVSETGDFQFGTNRGAGWVGRSGGMRATGGFNEPFSYTPVDTPSGIATLNALEGLIFAPIGSTGTVFGTWQTSTTSFDVEVGSWSMVAVPEPSALTIWALGGAVFLAGAAGRRRKEIKPAL